ncbi:hypothetical protein BpHYR1_038053 [Brachionus plicatilis]|uniref:Uncharacterized protein n=1 Tax=Brachionus plicatilis TaxID=10195 RepID=A0A3M7P3G4_BRAPC|nr:hypothetical protein BpHYR1_038053 [Brachionus plicatilis]
MAFLVSTYESSRSTYRSITESLFPTISSGVTQLMSSFFITYFTLAEPYFRTRSFIKKLMNTLDLE